MNEKLRSHDYNKNMFDRRRCVAADSLLEGEMWEFLVLSYWGLEWLLFFEAPRCLQQLLLLLLLY